MNAARLQVEGLSKSYAGIAALDEVALSVDAGTMVAVMGPSGSGKSTLLLSIAGILQPDRGRVLLDDDDVTVMSEADRSLLRRTRIGILFQFGQLIPELPAVENVALPLLLGGMRRRDALAQARQVLDRFGVADLASDRASSLSGGQAQRVALGRAVVTGPGLLLADEPTGALDSENGAAVVAELRLLCSERGMAAVVVTHDSSVAAAADRTFHLHDGALSPAAIAQTVGRESS